MSLDPGPLAEAQHVTANPTILTKDEPSGASAS